MFSRYLASRILTLVFFFLGVEIRTFYYL